MIHALLALFLLAQTSTAAPALSPQAMQPMQAGADAERQRDFETAIAQFRKVTELEPKAAIGFVRLGNAYMENRQYGEAIPSLKKALEQDPELPVAHKLLGYALLTQGYAAEAIPHLEKVREVGALGIAQIQTGQASDAVSNLQAALVKTPNDPDLLFYLSQASEMLSQQSLDAMTAADPNSSRTHQVRAHSYYRLASIPGSREGIPAGLDSTAGRPRSSSGIGRSLCCEFSMDKSRGAVSRGNQATARQRRSRLPSG